MDDATFLETVRREAALDSTDAARAVTNATLRTLGERLSAGEATDLALYLPKAFETANVPTDDEQPADYSVDEFVRRVSQRESIPKEDARTRPSLGCVLAETASEREIDAAKKQLPDPFGVCFEPPAANGDAYPSPDRRPIPRTSDAAFRGDHSNDGRTSDANASTKSAWFVFTLWR